MIQLNWISLTLINPNLTFVILIKYPNTRTIFLISINVIFDWLNSIIANRIVFGAKAPESYISIREKPSEPKVSNQNHEWTIVT